MSESGKTNLQWSVHTHGLFKEILGNPQCASLRIPLNIMLNLLKQVAQRAIKLNDVELNKLMLRLCLYSISNPDDPEYDFQAVTEILKVESKSEVEKP